MFPNRRNVLLLSLSAFWSKEVRVQSSQTLLGVPSVSPSQVQHLTFHLLNLIPLIITQCSNLSRFFCKASYRVQQHLPVWCHQQICYWCAQLLHPGCWLMYWTELALDMSPEKPPWSPARCGSFHCSPLSSACHSAISSLNTSWICSSHYWTTCWEGCCERQYQKPH